MAGTRLAPGVSVERSPSAVVVRGWHASGAGWLAFWMVLAWFGVAVLCPGPISEAVRGPAPAITGLVRERVPDGWFVLGLGVATTGLLLPTVRFEVRVTAEAVRMRWRALGWTYRDLVLPTERAVFRQNEEFDGDGASVGPSMHCAVFDGVTPLDLFLGSRRNADALVECLGDAVGEMRDAGGRP